MAVAEVIKEYIANMYCGGTTTLAGIKDFTEACMLNTLRTPLPAGYTHDTICTAEVFDWAALNIGWSPSAPPPDTVPTAIKDYIANSYCGGTTTLAGIKDFTEACMLNQLKTPLPSGESHATICVAAVFDWCANNIGYTASGAPPGPPGPYVPPSPPPTGKAQIRACTVPGGCYCVVDDVVDTQLTYACSAENPRWIGINVPTQTKMKVAFERLPDFLREDNIAKPSPGEVFWGPFSDGEIVHIRQALVAAPGAAVGTLQLFARDAKTGEYLGARPNINGISGEEKYLLLGADGIKIPLPVGNYSVSCTHPGYETPERVKVAIAESHTNEAPYAITFDMTEILIWKVVEILEEARKHAWVTAFDIESPIIYEVQSKGSITFEFLTESAYRVFFQLHPLPAGWTVDTPIASLPAAVKTVYCSITGDYVKDDLQYLNPILHTNRRYKAPFELIIERQENIAPGWYVAVTTIERWEP